MGKNYALISNTKILKYNFFLFTITEKCILKWISLHLHVFFTNFCCRQFTYEHSALYTILDILGTFLEPYPGKDTDRHLTYANHNLNHLEQIYY